MKRNVDVLTGDRQYYYVVCLRRLRRRRGEIHERSDRMRKSTIDQAQASSGICREEQVRVNLEHRGIQEHAQNIRVMFDVSPQICLARAARTLGTSSQ